jgi:hypothetical protein
MRRPDPRVPPAGFFFFPYIGPALVNPVCLGLYVAAALLFVRTREGYLRLEAAERKGATPGTPTYSRPAVQI